MELDDFIEELNDEILELKRADIIFITEYAYIQELFDAIIIPNGRRNSGLIRTFSETNEFLSKKLGKKITEEKYLKMLEKLLSHIGIKFDSLEDIDDEGD